MDKKRIKVLVLAGMLMLLGGPAFANTVQLCTAKATTGHCATYNDKAGHGLLRGHKTLLVSYTGSATVTATCIIGSEDSQGSATIQTVTGSNQTGITEFETNCSDVDVNVTVCSTCSVNAWLGSDF